MSNRGVSLDCRAWIMANFQKSKSAFGIIGINLEIGSSHDYKEKVF